MKNIFKQIVSKNLKNILLIIISLIFLLTLRGKPGNPLSDGKTAKINTSKPPFETSQERGRYALTVTLSESKTFIIDKFADFVKPDLGFHNGHYYSIYPPGISILAIPFYLIGKLIGLSQVFTFVVTTIFTIITCYIIYEICEELKFSKKSNYLSIFSFALASTIWPYSVTLSAHVVSALLISISFLIYLKLNKAKEKLLLPQLAILWLVLSLNLFVDYPNFVILIPIILFSVIKVINIRFEDKKIEIKIPMAIVYSFLSFLIIVLVFIFYSYSVFKTTFVFSNTYNIRFLSQQIFKKNINNINNNLLAFNNYSHRFSFDQLLNGFKVLTVSRDRGIFFYSPIFILSIGGLFLTLKKRNTWGLVIILTFLFNIIIYGSFDDPWGGWAFGPRYLIPSIPLLAILLGFALDNLIFKNFYLKLLYSILLIYSVAIALLGALTTNAVPPSVEAVYLNLNDTYISNFKLLLGGYTSSFIYNYTLIHKFIPPLFYFFILLSVLSIIGLILIWSVKLKQNV